MKDAHLTSADRSDLKMNADKSLALRRIPGTKAAPFPEASGSYKGDWKCAGADTGKSAGKEKSIKAPHLKGRKSCCDSPQRC
jgi:hypothetical protein